ncbi:MAG: redox-regulated ATPase YchF [Nanoarchaeota archaeon]|nr:redox-regulated ATPase YchF [Nanoarchaeota archaeon]
MLLGLVGKPSCGKSTFFKAATMADVLIAAYPFSTIKPNRGVGYVKIDCIDKDFHVQCMPRTGYCVKGKRFVPVELMDVAGLVEGASEGRGLGNQFLDDLRQADLFIHLVDVSGTTDAEGKETQAYDPVNDVTMLENELDLWYLGLLSKVWKVFARTVQNSKENFAKAVAKQFSGLKVNEDDVKEVLMKLKCDPEKPAQWTSEQLKNFAHELRHLTKPMIIAANKIDKKDSAKNLENLKKEYPHLTIIPCSADSELALRNASKAGIIEYLPGDSDFKINESKINDLQKKALENIKKNILEVYGSTGVQNVLNTAIFDLLKYIAVFPAGASKLADSKGNILPDCFLVPNGTTSLDFAYRLHTDLGDNFIRAIDAHTKQVIGKEHKLKHRDGVEIITR